MASDSITTGTKKQLLALLVVSVIAIGGIYVFDGAKDKPASTADAVTTSQVATASISADGKTASYMGVDGKTALELLKSYTKSDTKTFSGLGEYVVSINGLVSDDGKNYWSFYINDVAAQVGAGDYVTKSTDKIEWRLEDVATFAQ